MFRTVFAILAFAATCAYSQNVSTYYIRLDKNDSAPLMPSLTFDLSKAANDNSACVFTSSSEHKRRGKKDDIKMSTLAKNGIWNINRELNYKIFGGIASIKSADGKYTYKTIKIRGINPTDQDVEKFIKSISKTHWYAYAIARHESRQRFYVFNQFNSANCKETLRGVPNCGLPDGWGIMQIDSARGSQITTSEVYDWRQNIRGGIAVMDKALKEAKAYFTAVKRTFPDAWEEPPASILIDGTKTRLSYLDACVIQMYNGAAVVRRLKTPYGTYSSYRSAFEFDENAERGKRWKFKPNINKYVYKVVHNEIEGGIKSQNEIVQN